MIRRLLGFSLKSFTLNGDFARYSFLTAKLSINLKQAKSRLTPLLVTCFLRWILNCSMSSPVIAFNLLEPKNLIRGFEETTYRLWVLSLFCVCDQRIKSATKL